MKHIEQTVTTTLKLREDGDLNVTFEFTPSIKKEYSDDNMQSAMQLLAVKIAEASKNTIAKFGEDNKE